MSFSQLQLPTAVESLQKFAQHRNAQLQQATIHKQQLITTSPDYTAFRAQVEACPGPAGEHLADLSKASLRIIRRKVER
jgi:hypothetical protein